MNIDPGAVAGRLLCNLFVLAVIAVLGGCAGARHLQLPELPPVSRPNAAATLYDVFEVRLTAARTYENPYTQARVEVQFRAPGGRELTATAFHDGDNQWRARLAPDEVGRWTYRTRSDPADAGLANVTGEFQVDAQGDFQGDKAGNRGFIRPDARKRDAFSFPDGSMFFGIGDTAYGLPNAVDDDLLMRYLDKRKAQGFNFIRFFASGFAHEDRPQLPPQEGWPWGGTPAAPDYDRFNPQYFARLDRIFAELRKRDMHAEVLVFNYYSMPFQSPSEWTPAREAAWARYVIARLAAYTSVFLWTVTNEYELYPEGKYRYDGATDDDWVKRMGKLFHDADPHHHPTTTHNFTFDANGGIGGRFGAGDELDVISQQSWGQATWRGRNLEGTAEGIEQVIAIDRGFGKPVINTENGYEWLSGHSSYNKQATSTDKARRAAWRVFLAGGAAYAAGFAGTWRGSNDYHWLEDGPLFFKLRDMGLGSQIRHLQSFIAGLDLRGLSPAPQRVAAPNLCLADDGRTVIAYAPQGGTVSVDLSTYGGRSFAAHWYDPRNGQIRRLPVVKGGGVVTFRSRAGKDRVLQLQQLE